MIHVCRNGFCWVEGKSHFTPMHFYASKFKMIDPWRTILNVPWKMPFTLAQTSRTTQQAQRIPEEQPFSEMNFSKQLCVSLWIEAMLRKEKLASVLPSTFKPTPKVHVRGAASRFEFWVPKKRRSIARRASKTTKGAKGRRKFWDIKNNEAAKTSQDEKIEGNRFEFSLWMVFGTQRLAFLKERLSELTLIPWISSCPFMMY